MRFAGADADLIVWDSDATVTVEAASSAAAEADAVPADRSGAVCATRSARRACETADSRAQGWTAVMSVSSSSSSIWRRNFSAPQSWGKRQFFAPKSGCPLPRAGVARRVTPNAEVDGRLKRGAGASRATGRSSVSARPASSGALTSNTFSRKFSRGCAIDVCDGRRPGEAADIDAREGHVCSGSTPRHPAASQAEIFQTAASRLPRHGVVPTGTSPAPRADQSGRGRHGHGRRVQRHVLRIAAQPDHAGRCAHDGRGWGKRAGAAAGDWTVVRLGAPGASTD